MSVSNMNVFTPLERYEVTQKFGEDKACVKAEDGRPLRPLVIRGKSGSMCPWGFISFYKSIGLTAHNGVDCRAYIGTPIYFPVDAQTEWYAKNEKDSAGGLGLDVISKSPVINGQHVKFRFWHLSEQIVSDGETVRLGQKIALTGNTGASSGPHLHWSMKLCDAFGNTMNKDNGYRGAVDFAPYFENRFVLDVLGIVQKKRLREQLQILVSLLERLLKKYNI